jgi:hypothetical protein
MTKFNDNAVFVQILKLIDTKFLYYAIKESKIKTKYNTDFNINNIYIWKSWREKIPTKYFPIILEQYRQYLIDHKKITQRIDRLLKKHMQ